VVNLSTICEEKPSDSLMVIMSIKSQDHMLASFIRTWLSIKGLGILEALVMPETREMPETLGIQEIVAQ